MGFCPHTQKLESPYKTRSNTPAVKGLKFILGSKARGNKTKEMYYSLLSLKMISFVLSSQALQPSMNFNIILPMDQLFIPVILVISVTQSSLVVIPVVPVILFVPFTSVIPVILVILVIPVILVVPVILQYRSKVSWHSILDLARIESWDSILDCCFLILNSWKTHQTRIAFVYKWF